MKSEFIQPIRDDYFITEYEKVSEYPELVITSELAQENLQDYVNRYQGNLSEETILNIFT